MTLLLVAFSPSVYAVATIGVVFALSGMFDLRRYSGRDKVFYA